MRISNIVVGDRFRKDVGDLTSLIQSIREVGLLHPIVVSERGELIAGFRRLRAFQLMGLLDIPVTVVNLKDLRKGEIQENQVRKNFSVSEMVAVKRALEPEVKAEAEERMKSKLKQFSGENTVQENVLSGQTRDVVGSFVGLSGKTLEKAEFVVDAAEQHPDKFGKLLEKVDEGKTSISYAYQTIKRDNRHTETPLLPVDVFDIIMADPPWAYDFGIRGATDSHYSEMSTDQICDLKIPAAENCILFLWATAPKLQDALRVMESWGFIYKTHLIWVKDKIGTGYYFRAKHELLLLGKKGDVPSPMDSDRPESVLFAPRLDHSHKPHEMYGIIERMFPNRKYLELFARQKQTGWISWGNEITEN